VSGANVERIAALVRYPVLLYLQQLLDAFEELLLIEGREVETGGRASKTFHIHIGTKEANAVLGVPIGLQHLCWSRHSQGASQMASKSSMIQQKKNYPAL
jgi:hypothetical protein